ncbi:MAG: phenylacetate-CoA oxygenase subunit PaaJ [Burkholderiaceae bacterium]|nr:phenylacetate-CoA oxygenase subunit PaaJ [Burkholderiaceae bacterium]
MLTSAQAWDILKRVPDPEIPVISVTELGIVREVLRAVRVTTQLAPPWTTDWIEAEAQEKLRAYGIAPPGARAAETPQPLTFMPRIACPRCGSRDTERLSQFGATACKALHRCRACREPFEYFKPL